MIRYKIKVLDVDGGHMGYPDYADAYITEAEDENGVLLTEDELDNIPYDIENEKIFNFLND
jgi:hypothetical protein